MKRVVVSLSIFLILLAASITDAQFYYGSDGPVSLDVDSSKVLIKFDFIFGPQSQLTLLQSISRIVGGIDEKQAIDNFMCCSLSTGGQYSAFLDSLDTLDGIYLIEPYYQKKDGWPFTVGEQFIVAFDPDLTMTDIDSINAENGVIMDHLIYGFESIYVLRNTDSSGMRVLDLANYYHNMPNTIFAHPEFGMKYEKQAYTLYDWYHTEQDHLKKVIGQFNQKSVWDFAGLQDTIVVAVIDDGVAEHEDLPSARILPGHDFFNHISNAQPWGSDAHGMGCAGIIGASHSKTPPVSPYTYTGVISLNPNVKIMPLKIFHDFYIASNSEKAAAFNWAYINGADVTSCSWMGYPECLSLMVLDTAILRLYNDGRDGLGTPIIFSAGNYGQYAIGEISWPACLDYCFAVGATKLNDSLWYYSQFGSHLDVVAPSGDVCLQGNLWTLDQMDYWGYNDMVEEMCGGSVTWNCPLEQNNDNDYNCHFGGTSGACPIVSGIASLLISRRPDLTVDQIYDVLRYSAVTELDWGTITPHDYEYGYGRVDAFRAMLAITRGDANNDGLVNVGDCTYIIAYYNGGAEPQPDVLTGDANCDGEVGVADAVYLINYIWRGGPKPEICFKY